MATYQQPKKILSTMEQTMLAERLQAESLATFAKDLCKKDQVSRVTGCKNSGSPVAFCKREKRRDMHQHKEKAMGTEIGLNNCRIKMNPV